MATPVVSSVFIAGESVTAAGTGQQLTSRPLIQGTRIVIRARPNNTGYIYIATTAARAQSGNDRIRLQPGDSVEWDNLADPNVFYIDGDTTGEGIEIFGEGPGSA